MSPRKSKTKMDPSGSPSWASTTEPAARSPSRSRATADPGCPERARMAAFRAARDPAESTRVTEPREGAAEAIGEGSSTCPDTVWRR